MAEAIHTMTGALDLERSAISFYHEAFGFEGVDRIAFDDFTLLSLGNAENDFEVELTPNKGRTEPHDPGNGYGHLAVSVEDPDAERPRWAVAGFEPRDVVESEKGGSVLGKSFLVRDPGGYQIGVP